MDNARHCKLWCVLVVCMTNEQCKLNYFHFRLLAALLEEQFCLSSEFLRYTMMFCLSGKPSQAEFEVVLQLARLSCLSNLDLPNSPAHSLCSISSLCDVHCNASVNWCNADRLWTEAVSTSHNDLAMKFIVHLTQQEDAQQAQASKLAESCWVCRMSRECMVRGLMMTVMMFTPNCALDVPCPVSCFLCDIIRDACLLEDRVFCSHGVWSVTLPHVGNVQHGHCAALLAQASQDQIVSNLHHRAEGGNMLTATKQL